MQQNVEIYHFTYERRELTLVFVVIWVIIAIFFAFSCPSLVFKFGLLGCIFQIFLFYVFVIKVAPKLAKAKGIGLLYKDHFEICLNSFDTRNMCVKKIKHKISYSDILNIGMYEVNGRGWEYSYILITTANLFEIKIQSLASFMNSGEDVQLLKSFYLHLNDRFKTATGR
jgi:hypothetical protein